MEIYLLITRKFLFWPFRKWEIRSFPEPKSWRKCDIYWLLKSSCFNLFGNGIFGLFLSQKLTEILYLQITGKFLFWSFRWWEIRSFLSQEVDGKMIFSGYWEVLVLNVSVMGNTVFFQPKSWWKDDVYVVFLSFLSYSRTWEIWFFAQWKIESRWVRRSKNNIKAILGVSIAYWYVPIRWGTWNKTRKIKVSVRIVF